MSGAGGKSKNQTGSSQKVKTTITWQSQTTKAEAQEKGKMRAAGTVDIDEEDQEVGDAEKGREYLEAKLLFVSAGDPLTLYRLAMSLFQIAALPGTSQPVVNAVHAVAYSV
ncbi:uncharacterized protein LACBIDRAFT_327839 [Laccaria bicolor S238N-H82]|uniref:Predicted protein n=1 Tax=Laccaria bicolor (strain S238N-H82 / ATCC MYA-4686) TaxID=486041 RepID=B0DCZ8_LACBS|nr:uncharacterized protein LACBIDRAFT_327839 [Laccaria bicolor S238N-H82]EDR07526.1 predicted protein [Laccaria bicolor S238N-H82]|eukprot:XP_001881918.1 predicted protein [Laccaria bicolor S238N-H82]